MTVEAQVTLDMIRIQLNWLEREMLALRQAIGQRIVATALFARELFEEPVTLLTRDKAIAESGLIPVLW